MTALNRREALVVGGAAAATAALASLAPAARAARPAAPVGGQPAGFYRFKIGSHEALALCDAWNTMSPAHPLFAPEATPEQFAEVMGEHFLPADRVTLYVNVLCVRMGGEVVLIDTGNAPGRGPTSGLTAAHLAAAGVPPDEVTAIFISHAHPDHVGGLVSADGGLVYPNARCFINRVEHEFWTGASPDLSRSGVPEGRRAGMVAAAQASLEAVREKLEPVRGGDTTLPGVELVETFGHTPGHTSIILSDGDQRLAAMGDLAHNHVVMFARPDWTIAFDTDPRAAAQARKTMFRRLADERLRVFGYHVPWPAVGHIAAHAEGFVWVPQPWDWSGG
ncbi:MAG: MBL fold metallo-hydrolase [Phycisphaerae bacterium]|nr:MBL fold metallo-hydrolase [Phycisphaerae bacterium]